MEAYNQYWDMLVTLKYKHLYYQQYHTYSQRNDIIVTFILTVATFGGISLWMIWDNHPVAWGCTLFFIQSLQFLNLILPFSQRVKPLQFMIDEMYRLILDMQSDYDSLDIDNPDKINSLKQNYCRRFDSLEQQYLNGLYLPYKERFKDKAQKENENYFFVRYSKSIKEEDNYDEQ